MSNVKLSNMGKFHIKCSCGNEMYIPHGRVDVDLKDSIDLISPESHTMSIICKNCQAESQIYL